MRGISTGSAEYYTDSQVVGIPRRSADDVDLAAGRHPPDRHRAHRVAARSAGNAVRVELAVGHDPLHHEQAGCRRLFRRRSTSRSARPRAARRATTSAVTSTSRVSDNFAVRAVGFYSDEGGYVDNVLGDDARWATATTPTSSRTTGTTSRPTAAASRRAGRSTRSGRRTLSLISQYSHADGSWESDPALGDYKITRFFEEWRDDDWYQTSLNVKGDLGFAELSVTASYFDRNDRVRMGQHEL